jgi:hypothetical protein
MQELLWPPYAFRKMASSRNTGLSEVGCCVAYKRPVHEPVRMCLSTKMTRTRAQAKRRPLQPASGFLYPHLAQRTACVPMYAPHFLHLGSGCEMCTRPNETQAQPRLRGTQVAASIGTLATLDINERRRLSRWLQRLVRPLASLETVCTKIIRQVKVYACATLMKR